MAKNIQAIRGMHDILPSQTPLWEFLEDSVRSVLQSYGYQQIRMPIMEMTELFKRSIGEVTDIVEKEMYTFADRNGDFLTLRPEGTAGCVRAAMQNGLLHNQQQRLWYQGPMFRHERPQKGRYRQFQQIGVETYGMQGPDIDIEMMLMTHRLWQTLGLKNLELQINSLGSSAERASYREILVAYFEENKSLLDEDSLRRLGSNPLRILDSKNPALQALIEQAPKLMAHLGEASLAHFQAVCDALEMKNIPYQVNTRLVRGLDYYSLTVFEWVTKELGAQGTVCAGGRYDGLVEQLGGKSIAAVGFAMGVERLVSLLEQSPPKNLIDFPHIYLILAGDEASKLGFLLAESLRDLLPSLRIVTHCGAGSFKRQFKKADKSGAVLALILGDDELAEEKIGVKFLREKRDQETLSLADLAAFVSHHLSIEMLDIKENV